MNRPRHVIAHRGASGYLPEHTLASKALAHGMGADFIEQDVVLSRDHVPLVLHDIYLDTVTDVRSQFPERARTDGRYYALDFSWAEIQQLHVHERVHVGTDQAVYPGRFSQTTLTFRIPSLSQEIELIQGLNRSTGRNVGLYPEIKAPAWHRQQAVDISRIVIDVLQQYGYQSADDNIFVQCFDAQETQRLRYEFKSRLKLVQLIGNNSWKEAPTDFTHLRTPSGIAEVAKYAQAVGPHLSHVISGIDERGGPRVTPFVSLAHDQGMQVHAYTVRADDLPAYVTSFNQLMELLIRDADVDGVFSDFPDRSRHCLQALRGQG